MRAWADIRLYWHEGTDDISINLSIGVLELDLFSPVREALAPDVVNCLLHVVVHPMSMVKDILFKFLVCRVQFLEIFNHPTLNLGAVAVVVVEHPDTIVISHTIMWWVPVVEPLPEVVEDCQVPVDDMLIPSLFIVAHFILERE